MEKYLSKYKSIVLSELNKIYCKPTVVGREDLMQEANIAIFRAYTKYNTKPKKELDKLIRISIRHSIQNYIDKFYGPFRLPGNIAVGIKKFVRLKEKKKSRQDICEEMGIGENEYNIYERIEGVQIYRL